MLDARNPQDLAPQVSQWAFDAVAGRISAVDGQGRELMAITADPLFGPRLAAAFGWPAMAIGPWQQASSGLTAPPRPVAMLQPVVRIAAAAPEVALQV